VISRPAFKLPATDTVCYKQAFTIVPLELKDTLQTIFSWTSTDRSINLQDSLRPNLTIYPAVTAKYILTGKNNCFAGGVQAKDTFDIVVIDSISAAHSYALLQDNFTTAPVQFSSSFYPQSFLRRWTLRNEDGNWDSILVGESPLVRISRGGAYESKVVVSSVLGSHYCADTVAVSFIIKPLGTVFIPNLVLEGGAVGNATFIVTARDENNEKLRDITDGKLVIYNRWGKKVYEKENYNNDLDSKKLKEEFTDGIYFFEFSVARYNFKNSGWLQINPR
jgi:hypothetical protein